LTSRENQVVEICCQLSVYTELSRSRLLPVLWLQGRSNKSLKICQPEPLRTGNTWVRAWFQIF